MLTFSLGQKIKLCFLFVILLFISSSYGFAQKEDGQKSLSLNECVTIALSKHPAIEIYQQRIEQRKEQLNAVSAQNFPQVDAIASYDRLSYVTPAKQQRYLGDSKNDYQADILVIQPLFTGGRIASQKNSARYSVEAAKQGYLAAKEDVIYGVKDAYFKLIYALDIVKSKEDLLEYAELAYETASDLYQRTKTPREETLLRLGVQVGEVKQELVRAKDNAVIARKALLNAMGIKADGSVEVLDLKNEFEMDEDIPVSMDDNYEILSSLAQVKAADEQINAVKSDLYPQINARYGYGYEWGRWSQEGASDWIAGVAISLNVWDWGMTKAQVRQAKSYKKELESYQDLLTRQIGFEIQSAKVRYESAYNRWTIAKSSCEQARKSLDMFSARYRDSLVTSIELLDAQRAFSQAQVNCALSKLDIRLAKAEIEKLAGEGSSVVSNNASRNETVKKEQGSL